MDAERLAQIRELLPESRLGPRDVAEESHTDCCWRTGVSVTLADGVCPECGWSYDGSMVRAVKVPAQMLRDLLAEVDRLRAERDEARRVALTWWDHTEACCQCLTRSHKCGGDWEETAEQWRRELDGAEP